MSVYTDSREVLGIVIGSEVDHARIHIALDGTVTLAEGVMLDEASALFWNMIASAVKAIQPYEMRRMRLKMAATSPCGTEMQEPAPHTLGGFARRWVANHGLVSETKDEAAFVGCSLVELVDCLRLQGHSAATAAHTVEAFLELIADYENEESPEWGQFWMSEAGQGMRANPPIKRGNNG